jgi:nucleoporin POM152
LEGVPPFEIVYEFEGKRQKVTTGSPFSRVASSPGNLTLISLKDSASGCTADLSHLDSIIVHNMPSVRNIGLGNRDIHEGDETELRFEFSGAPPFTFTYTRSERVGTPPRLKPVEAHSVSNVDDHEYTILTSLEGEYQVIALEDKYCTVSFR